MRLSVEIALTISTEVAMAASASEGKPTYAYKSASLSSEGHIQLSLAGVGEDAPTCQLSYASHHTGFGILLTQSQTACIVVTSVVDMARESQHYVFIAAQTAHSLRLNETKQIFLGTAGLMRMQSNAQEAAYA